MAEEDDGGFKSLIDEFKKSAERRQQNLNKTLGDDLERRPASEQVPKKKKKKKKRNQNGDETQE